MSKCNASLLLVAVTANISHHRPQRSRPTAAMPNVFASLHVLCCIVSAFVAASGYRPVVLMHGVNIGGDVETNMGRVEATLKAKFPGIYVKQITTYSGWSSLVRSTSILVFVLLNQSLFFAGHADGQATGCHVKVGACC